ncbi:hypothetical protein B9Z19DRAFT_1135604 [Tuber borchii]|uniref:Glycoside hydrolase family 2 immunoglobulin-like beta-sandwich domain-containing protein n=1 Tax=Tuber borchii TaxID=42251 RepID=A0A2T6ZCQ7_TUBBO|nr:hypothetical protein B9Z19DRAFT_1135604 [Tuber borchii]
MQTRRTRPRLLRQRYAKRTTYGWCLRKNGRRQNIAQGTRRAGTLDKADTKVSAKISGSEGKRVLVEVGALSGAVVEKKEFEVRGEEFEGGITVIKPELWWPHTHGAQPGYELTVELLSGNKHLLKSASSTFFTFPINHTPIFSGALVWQLNDNWPGVSWAIADYYLHPKSVFFAMKRALALVSRLSKRIAVKENLNILRQGRPLSQFLPPDLNCCYAKLRCARYYSGEIAPVSHSIASTSTIKPNCAIELVTIEVPFLTITSLCNPSLSNWRSTSLKFGRDEFVVKSAKPVKGLVLQVPLEGGDAIWGDNYIDVVPSKEAHVPGVEVIRE